MTTKNLLLTVKTTRKDEKRARETKKNIEASLELTNAAELVAITRVARKEAEAALRDHVSETGDAILGIKFRDETTPEYTDEDGLSWCKENFAAIVSEIFDKKQLNKLFKGMDLDKLPDFVKMNLVKKVTIPTDLSKIE